MVLKTTLRMGLGLSFVVLSLALASLTSPPRVAAGNNDKALSLSDPDGVNLAFYAVALQREAYRAQLPEWSRPVVKKWQFPNSEEASYLFAAELSKDRVLRLVAVLCGGREVYETISEELKDEFRFWKHRLLAKTTDTMVSEYESGKLQPADLLLAIKAFEMGFISKASFAAQFRALYTSTKNGGGKSPATPNFLRANEGKPLAALVHFIIEQRMRAILDLSLRKSLLPAESTALRDLPFKFPRWDANKNWPVVLDRLIASLAFIDLFGKSRVPQSEIEKVKGLADEILKQLSASPKLRLEGFPMPTIAIIGKRKAKRLLPDALAAKINWESGGLELSTNLLKLGSGSLESGILMTVLCGTKEPRGVIGRLRFTTNVETSNSLREDELSLPRDLPNASACLVARSVLHNIFQNSKENIRDLPKIDCLTDVEQQLSGSVAKTLDEAVSIALQLVAGPTKTIANTYREPLRNDSASSNATRAFFLYAKEAAYGIESEKQADKEIARCAQAGRDFASQHGAVYGISVCLLWLEEHYRETIVEEGVLSATSPAQRRSAASRVRAKMSAPHRRFVDDSVAALLGSEVSGAWGYAAKEVDKIPTTGSRGQFGPLLYMEEDISQTGQMERGKREKKKKGTKEKEPEKQASVTTDAHNTHFALLGLNSAAHLGAKIPAEAFDKILDRLCDAVQKTSADAQTIDADDVIRGHPGLPPLGRTSTPADIGTLTVFLNGWEYRWPEKGKTDSIARESHSSKSCLLACGLQAGLLLGYDFLWMKEQLRPDLKKKILSVAGGAQLLLNNTFKNAWTDEHLEICEPLPSRGWGLAATMFVRLKALKASGDMERFRATSDQFRRVLVRFLQDDGCWRASLSESGAYDDVSHAFRLLVLSNSLPPAPESPEETPKKKKYAEHD